MKESVKDHILPWIVMSRSLLILNLPVFILSLKKFFFNFLSLFLYYLQEYNDVVSAFF